MTATMVTPDQDALVTEIAIGAPPERVFRALTDPAQLERWFSGDATCPVKFWKMDARRGGEYRYETAQSSTLVINGVNEFKCHGEILDIDPPRLLVYTWIANWHDDKQRKTVVRWELTPIGKGTLVKVTHSGLAQEKVAREDYRGGWPGVVENLKKFTEAGKD
ncbi:MAG TPA: SRPBCC domain-containing protein [Terriglobales bacterium]|nr:SRPBCC domain-containing protein [Terriglobales bacterium]